jgi:cysteinyl-tRNA synthetase, unknown class
VYRRAWKLVCGVAIAFALSLGVVVGSSVGPFGIEEAQASYDEPNDFVYQLQNIDLDALGQTEFDLVIMDYSRDGSDEEKFTADEISALKDSPGGQKRVLSYMSIGEAENYRWYWQKSWDANRNGKPDAGAPAWLGPSNPDWPGNYKVRYWDAGWQEIVYAYVDKVLDAGYDGVYLDIVDAYQYWEPGGPGSPDHPTAEEDMVEFVKDIAQYARITEGHPDFQVFVQNAEELSTHPDYVATVSGIGKEDLFYTGNRRQPASETNWSVSHLDVFKAAGKPVLVTDYVTKRTKKDTFYEKARSHGYVPFATRRNLHALPTYPGPAPG